MQEEVLSNTKISKTEQQRLLDLEFHLWSLHRDLQEVLTGDFYFLKPRATTLRVLVIEKGNNKPLLINLAREFNVSLPVKRPHYLPLHYSDQEYRDGLFENDPLMPLERYIQFDSIGTWIEAAVTVNKKEKNYRKIDENAFLNRRTIKDLILAVAEKDGSAHEDVTLPKWLADEKTKLDGEYNRVADKLYVCGRHVLMAGVGFLYSLAEEEKYSFTRPWDKVPIRNLAQHPPGACIDDVWERRGIAPSHHKNFKPEYFIRKRWRFMLRQLPHPRAFRKMLEKLSLSKKDDSQTSP